MSSGPRTYLKACINGARTPDQHPNLPVTPDQLAAAAVAAHQAGARAVHMHPKTADGVDSLQAEVVGAAVRAVRHAAPGLPLGVTTGFWALSDPDERLRAVEAWTVLPDFASVNWHEPGSESLAHLLLRMGLGVEVGIFHAEAAASWAGSEIAAHCMRVMVELGPDGDVATADDVLGGCSRPVHPPRFYCMALTKAVGLCWNTPRARGVQTRIGMEDTLLLPDGSTAPDNAALVSAAVQLLSR